MSRQLYKMPRLKKEVAIYLAGLIDGEGCFYIASSKKHPNSADKVYCPQFKLVLVDEPTISWVADKLERHYTRQAGNPLKNHKDTFTIRISDREGLIRFTEQILPYLILKKRAAENMVEFCKSRAETSKQGYNMKYTTEEVSFFNISRQLNRVGVRLPQGGSL